MRYAGLLNHRILNRKEERDLLSASQAGNAEAREELILFNMRLVYSIAKRYKEDHLNIEELINEGVIGLIRAIDTFDLKRSNRLSTFATILIHQTIGHSRLLQNTVRLPRHIQTEVKLINRVKIELAQKGNVNPTALEIAIATDLPVEKVNRLKGLDKAVLDVFSIYPDPDQPDQLGLIDKLGEEDKELELIEQRHDLDFFLSKIAIHERFVVERLSLIHI